MGFLGLGGDPKQQFVREVLAALAESGPEQPKYDEKRFEVTQGSAIFPLEVAFETWAKLPKDQRPQWLSRYRERDGLEALPKDKVALLAMLLPMIRERSWPELTPLTIRLETGKRFDETFPYGELGVHLAVTLVAHQKSALQSVTFSHLTAAGIVETEAFTAAGANLRALPSTQPEELSPGLFAYRARDDMDGSRILLHACRTLQVQGKPIAFIAGRNALFIAGSQDEAALKALHDAGHAAMKDDPRRLPAVLLCFEHNEWKPWLPEERSPNYEAFATWAFEARLERYNSQKKLLDQVEADPYFYTSLMATDGEPRSTVAFWFPIPSMIAKADRLVVRIDGGGEPLADVTWDDAMSVVGHRLKKADGYPERYRAEGHPTAGELERLSALSR